MLQSCDLNGRLLSTSPVFLKGTRYLQMISLPAAGDSPAAHGAVFVKDRSLHLIIAGADGWLTYNLGLKVSSIQGLTVGSDAAGKRWLVILLRDRTVRSVEIPVTVGISGFTAELVEALSGTRIIVK